MRVQLTHLGQIIADVSSQMNNGDLSKQHRKQNNLAEFLSKGIIWLPLKGSQNAFSKIPLWFYQRHNWNWNSASASFFLLNLRQKWVCFNPDYFYLLSIDIFCFQSRSHNGDSNIFSLFANIPVQISPNNKKVNIFKLYTERAVENCWRINF